jgi:hypothetical protein
MSLEAREPDETKKDTGTEYPVERQVPALTLHVTCHAFQVSYDLGMFYGRSLSFFNIYYALGVISTDGFVNLQGCYSHAVQSWKSSWFEGPARPATTSCHSLILIVVSAGVRVTWHFRSRCLRKHYLPTMSIHDDAHIYGTFRNILEVWKASNSTFGSNFCICIFR